MSPTRHQPVLIERTVEINKSIRVMKVKLLKKSQTFFSKFNISKIFLTKIVRFFRIPFGH